MGRYVRSNTDFEFKYAYGSDLCLLENLAQVGTTEIFPNLNCYGDELDDLNFCLIPRDLVLVHEDAEAFDAFKDVFMQIRDYFLKKDAKGFQKYLEEVDGIDYDMDEVFKADEVKLIGMCYYTFIKEDWLDLLTWINLHLTGIVLSLEDFNDEKKVKKAISALSKYGDNNNTDLPLLALMILQDAVLNNSDVYTAHDSDEVWMTPIVLDGEVVNEDTEIDEYDNYMF